MSNDQVIRFGGDVGGLTNATDRGRRGIEGMENAAKKTGAAAKSIGDQLGQTFTGMAKGVLITAAFTKSLEAAAEAAERIRKAGAETSEAIGKEAVDVERAILATGTKTTPEQRQSLLGMVGQGVTKYEETAGFIQAFAKKRGRRFTFAEAQRATEAYTSGAFTQDELLEASTIPTAAEQQARLAQLSPEAQREFRIRAKQRTQEAETRAAAAANPFARYVDEEVKKRQLESPFQQSIMEGIKKLPGLGGTAAETEAMFIMLQQSRRARENREQTMRLPDEQVQRLAPAPKPIMIQGPRE